MDTQPCHVPGTDAQTVLEQDEAGENLQYSDGIIMWGNRRGSFEKRKKIVQIPEKASFALKQSKVKTKGEIQFLGITWQDKYHEDVINNNNNLISIIKLDYYHNPHPMEDKMGQSAAAWYLLAAGWG